MNGEVAGAAQRVVVIGAGLAGLTAAYRLRQAGVGVEVYEARGRVGGRVLTVRVNDEVVELGGQNITDGGEAASLRALVKECGLSIAERMSKIDMRPVLGETAVPLKQLLREKNFHPGEMAERLTALAKEHSSMRGVLDGILSAQDPLYQTLATLLAGYEGGSIDDLSSSYITTLYHMLQGGFAAVHTGGTDEEKTITLASIAGGGALLPQRLAGMLGGDLHLSMPLIRVERSLGGQGYTLTFADGMVVAADILVLAIPCSVYADIEFGDGVIQPERLAAIQRVRYGTNAKIIVPLAKDPGVRCTFIDRRLSGFFPTASRTIFGFYCTGEAACFTPDTLQERYQEGRRFAEKLLEKGSLPTSDPVCAQDEAFSSYSVPVGYSWPNDPFAKGSYAYIAAGQEGAMTALESVEGEVVKKLFAPLGNLYFAGEHASVLLDVPGTMEAACESGERAARMIIARFLA